MSGKRKQSAKPSKRGKKVTKSYLGKTLGHKLLDFKIRRAKKKIRKHLSPFQLIIRNLRGRMYRSVITIICVAIVIGTLFSTILLMDSMDRGLTLGFQRFGADLLVVPEGNKVAAQDLALQGVPVKFYMDGDIEDKVASIPGVEKTAPQLFVVSLSGAACCSTGEIHLIAIDPEKDFTVTPWLETHLEEPIGEDELIVGATNIFGPGDSLRFYGHRFTIKGKLEPTGLGFDASGYMTFKTARVMIDESPEKAVLPLNIPEGTISAVLVKVGPEWSKNDVARDIEQTIVGADVISTTDLTKTVKGQVAGMMTSLVVFGIAMWGISIVLIGAIFIMIVNERRGEIGLLRSIGATGSFVFRLIMSEAVLLTMIGGVLGIAGGGALLLNFSEMIKTSLDILYLWPSIPSLAMLVGASLGLAAAIGVIASFYPALRSSRIEPYEAMRTGRLW